MTTYVYDKEKGRLVLKSERDAERHQERVHAIKVGGDGRFVSQRCEPNLGRGTAYAAPQYVDGQPAFTSVAQAEKFAAAHGMEYAKDYPSASEIRSEKLRQRDERRQARDAMRRR